MSPTSYTLGLLLVLTLLGLTVTARQLLDERRAHAATAAQLDKACEYASAQVGKRYAEEAKVATLARLHDLALSLFKSAREERDTAHLWLELLLDDKVADRPALLEAFRGRRP